jgi:ATP-dependent exoDNAse (exonuclease V) alpha subunit
MEPNRFLRPSIEDERARLVSVLKASLVRRRREAIHIVEPPAPEPPRLVLSDDQAAAVEIVLAKIASGARVTTLAGAAGTGKTTCVRVILDQLGCPYVQAAPTGKAALRLKQVTGEPAVTLHRIAYQGAVEDEDGDLEFNRREAGSVGGGDLFGNFGGGDSDPFAYDDFDGDIADWSKRISQALREGGRAVIVIDEASMVGEEILRDLIGPSGCLGPRVQLLAVGDHCQLPPVKAIPGFDLERADAKLDRVHRQAEGSPLLMLATEHRLHRRVLTPAAVRAYGLDVQRMTAAELGQRVAVAVDFAGADYVALAATNRQRMAINLAARRSMGLPPLADGPQVGEIVMALDNSWGAGCANGETGTVLESSPWRLDGLDGWKVKVDFGSQIGVLATVRDAWAGDDAKTSGRVPYAIRQTLKSMVWKGGRRGLDADKVLTKLVGLTPAYGMTVHKSQGSEYPTGAFVLGGASWLGDDEWRLGYTGVTRFRESCIFVTGCAS